MSESPVLHPDSSLRPFVVDLDGTLCKTDTLWESFLAGWRLRWWLPFAALLWVFLGRSQLKQRLANVAMPEVESLPWNEAVVTALRAARAEGRPTVLATAANEKIANACAAATGLFDTVLASRADDNLKGPKKAELLVAKFGEGGFDYVGDARADIAVWRHAHDRISVSNVVPEGGRQLAPSMPKAGGLALWARLLRVRHWIKNVLVFVAPVAAHQWAEAATWQAAMLTFAAFCLVCSAVYLLNDLFDLAADRAHPTKRRRPLAAGDLSLAHATLLAPLLLVGGLALAFAVGPRVGAVLTLYVVVNAFYTAAIKRVPVFDVFCLAGLYTLRIVAGAVAVAVPLSAWLVAFSVFAFLSLALLKRSADIARLAPDELLPGRGYRGRDAAFVNGFGMGSAIAASLVLSLYVASDQVATLYHEPLWLWGVAVVVLVWLARMWRIAMNGTMDDDPVLFAATDPVSWGCALGTAIFVAMAVPG